MLLLVAVTAALITIEIRATSALILTAAIAALAYSGGLLLRSSGANSVSFGISAILGMGLYVTLGQLTLLIGLRSPFAHVAALSGTVLLGWCSSTRRANSQRWRLINFGNHQFVAVAIGTLSISLRHPWLLPLATGLLVAERLTRSPRSIGIQISISASAIAIGTVISVWLRPDRWWYFYQGNDAQFFESLGWSIARWTIFEHPGLSGGSIANYHWLTYGLLGGFGELAGLDPWDGLTKFGVLLIPTLLAVLLLGSSKHADEPISGLHSLFILLVVGALPGARVDSFAFSIVVAFGYLTLLQIEFDHKRMWGEIGILTLMSSILIFTKVSTAAVVGAILVTAIAIQHLRNQRKSGLPAVVLISTFAVFYFLLFRFNDSEMLRNFSFSTVASVEEIVDLLDTPAFLTLILLCIATGLIVSGRHIHLFGGSQLGVSIILVSAVSLTSHVLLAGPSTSYFGLPGVMLLSLSLVQYWVQESDFDLPKNTRLRQTAIVIALLGAMIAGFMTETIANRINRRLPITSLTGDRLWNIFQGSGTTALIIVMLLVGVARKPRRRPIYPAAAIVLGLGVLAGSLMNDFRKVATWGPGIYTTSDANAAAFGSDGLDEVSRYIRAQTPIDAILASNNFCCFGEEWFPKDVETRARSFATTGETSLGGANYLLPANTQRRFLIQGLRFQTGYRPPSQDQENRVRLSLSFANNPSQQDVDRLKRYGVSGFVVNLALTNHRDWSVFATEKYRSESFVYFELK